MSEPFQEVTVSIDEGIAILTLNRPKQYNALGARIVDELGAALANIETGGEARVVIVTGAGEQAFCAGVDLKERREMTADQRWAHNRGLNEFVERLGRLQVRTIGGIYGLGLGGGFDLTVAWHFRIWVCHS